MIARPDRCNRIPLDEDLKIEFQMIELKLI